MIHGVRSSRSLPIVLSWSWSAGGLLRPSLSTMPRRFNQSSTGAAWSVMGLRNKRPACGSTRSTHLLKGGKSGPAVIAGKGFESLLYRGIAGASEDIAPMPLREIASPQKQIDLIQQWIDEGAKGKTAAKRVP